MRSPLTLVLVTGSVLLLILSVGANADGGSQGRPFIGPFHTINSASTVPGNGDINPYGVAVVPRTVGSLVQNNILVSNFNNSTNAQGTGSTIVQITPEGNLSLFAQISPSAVPGCVGGVGLTTALVVLRSGWVIVGSLPTSNGMAATAQAGCLIVLNSSGKPVETFAGNGINGPWDMTALDLTNFAVLFITNVLNSTVAGNGAVVNQGTVLRMVLALGDGDGDSDDNMPRALNRMVIANGFGERTDPNALVIGPTGVGLGLDGTLYVADSLANRIAAIPFALIRLDSAGTGRTVSQNGAINGPLGLTIAPGGDILEVNSGDGNMVEITPNGQQVAVKNVDTTGAGAGTLFGLAVNRAGNGVYFVNDGNNTLNILH
jgi:hypothetical protein